MANVEKSFMQSFRFNVHFFEFCKQIYLQKVFRGQFVPKRILKMLYIKTKTLHKICSNISRLIIILKLYETLAHVLLALSEIRFNTPTKAFKL